jgi:hypothetical protein
VPNITSQVCTNQSLTIVASDGGTFTVTKAEIQAFLATQGGNAAARKAATIDWVKANIETTLGPKLVTASMITFNFDALNDASQIVLEITSI